MHLKNSTLLQGGKYMIVRFIASGGFGCTYEAQHTLLDERVALKEFFKKEINGHKGTYKNDKEYNGKWYFLGSNELYSEVINGKEIVK